VTELRDGWTLASTDAGAAGDPRELGGLQWLDAPVPGTVAGALRAAGLWSFDDSPDLDGRDWWYRCAFPAEVAAEGTARALLRFEGLATLADVWLNGALVLRAEDMFVRYDVDVQDVLRERNEMWICFRSLRAALAARRPRPRWKTRLVEHQQLRWLRTSLLGRIPAWSPPAPPIGPWRPAALTTDPLREWSVRASARGDGRMVEVRCIVDAPASASVSGELALGAQRARLEALHDGHRWSVAGVLRAKDLELWWPHTHGRPALHDCRVSIAIGRERRDVDVRVGFRTIEVEREGDGFGVRVNGVPVFCRGACWTPPDVVALPGGASDYEPALRLLRDAGANMVRVGGTMVYETEAFHDLCDELGLLVWQDFMFANMDYPAGDEAFVARVRTEASQVVARLRRHPSTAVYCGNSEVEQQAAMVGIPRDGWRNDLFARVLPGVCEELDPGACYVPSTPHGGAMPFHTASGVTHYFGVGAYRRPLEDARRASVRFASECLAFANVPADDVVDEVMKGAPPAPHDPRWKRRVPRDAAAGWDFEDVRDHYVRERFGLDPFALRASDPRAYLEWGRIASGEVMAAVFSEWRSARSTCRGGLVWFLRDLWPGAGWGVLDSRGRPKACFHFLARVWQPRAVVVTDEGLDGLHLHVVNETAAALTGTLSLTLLRNGRMPVAHAQEDVEVPARAVRTRQAEEMFGAFHDTACAYLFGPRQYDVAVATLSADGAVVGQAFHFPVAARVASARASDVAVRAHRGGAGRWDVTVRSDTFLHAVRFDAGALRADDDYFHLVPGVEKTTVLRGDPAAEFDAALRATNLDGTVRIPAAP
jgi:beta-mannosidase